jgi:microcystin degradation protein MlrC
LRELGPWDGVYLVLHGALAIDGRTDAEGDLVAAVRSVVGPDCIIAASYDLHGNISGRAARNLDIVTAYRTAPHVDAADTQARAVKLLATALRTGARPHTEYVYIPTLLPGEQAMTTAEPAAALYASLPEIIGSYELLDASYLVGFVWADEERVGSAAVAVSHDADTARRAAGRMAEAWWERRSEFAFGMETGSVEECVQRAARRATSGGPVFVSDAGDNITAGGVGDVTALVGEMLRSRLTNAVYAAIVDPDAVAACFRVGPQNRLQVALGGKLDTRNGGPLRVDCEVVRLSDAPDGNRAAVVRVGDVRIVVTAERTAFTTVSRFEEVGIDLSGCGVVGVKLGYLFPELRDVARDALLAMSPGVVNPDVTALPYRSLRRPMYPLEAGRHLTDLT